MRRNKFAVFIFILSLSAALSCLTACGFVSYEKGRSENDAEYQQSLTAQKQLYIEKLENLSSLDLYFEEEMREYLVRLTEGKNQISDCETIDELENIFGKNAEIILAIKTISDYEEERLASYKTEKISEICAHVKLAEYRAEERQAIENALNVYSEKILQASDYAAADNFVSDYKIEIYAYKTDAELYAEELAELKEKELKAIGNYVNLIDYRYDETLIIQSVLASFTSQIKDSAYKENVLSLSENCKLILDGVKDDKTLYEEEKTALAEEKYAELLSYADLRALTDEEKLAYLNRCTAIKADMLNCQSKSEVNFIFITEKKQFFEAGAVADDLTCLNYYQDALIEGLEYYLDASLYRAEQLKDVSKICGDGAFRIRKCSTYQTTASAYDDTLTRLDGVLTNDEMWRKEDEDFRAELKSLYGGKILAEPESLTEADDYYELAKIIDYYAFYQKDWQSFVRNSFRVKINWSHKDAVWERNEVYWYCELLKSAVDIKTEFEDNDYLVITLIPYHFAYLSNASETKKAERAENLVGFDSDKSGFIGRDDDFADFPYYSYPRTAAVWNSQQLWYALEHGYIPECLVGSPAEKVLNDTKRILCEIIKEGMSDEEKIFEIYSWFGRNVQYDDLHVNFNYSSDGNNLPNEVISALQSHFVEGAINDGLAVCIGYAKAYLLMLRIEGIEAKFNLARMPYMDGVNSINSIAGAFHAYVLLNLDGAWYYSDPQKSSTGPAKEFGSFAYICLPKDVVLFVEVMNNNLISGTDSEFYKNLCFNGKKTFVTGKEELYTILEEFSSYSNKFRLAIFYDSTYPQCYIDLISYEGCYDVMRISGDGGVINELIISKFEKEA